LGEAFVASRSEDRPAVCVTRNDVQPSICWIVALELMESIPNGPWKRDAAWDANPKVEKERGESP
jgi:hypothetical protein